MYVCVLEDRETEGEITFKAPTWECSCHRWCLEVQWQLAHSVSLHVVQMQSVCVYVCLCPDMLLLLAGSCHLLRLCSVSGTVARRVPHVSASFYVSARPTAALGLQEFVLGFIHAAKKLSVVKLKSGLLPPGCCFPICFHLSDQF